MIRIVGACTAALLAVGGVTACGENVRQLGRPAPVGGTAPAQAPQAAAEPAPRHAGAAQRPSTGRQHDRAARGVVQHRTVTKTEKIPFTTEQVEDPSMVEGTSAVRTFGVPGSKTLTFRVAWRDGRPVGRELVGVKVVKRPVTEVVVIGTRPAPKPAPPSERVEKAPPADDGPFDGGRDDEGGRDDDGDRDEADGEDCHPNYGGCVPRGATDVDCLGGPGNGPRYVRGPVTVLGPDVYGLDADNDGTGCED